MIKKTLYLCILTVLLIFTPAKSSDTQITAAADAAFRNWLTKTPRISKSAKNAFIFKTASESSKATTAANGAAQAPTRTTIKTTKSKTTTTTSSKTNTPITIATVRAKSK